MKSKSRSNYLHWGTCRKTVDGNGKLTSAFRLQSTAFFSATCFAVTIFLTATIFSQPISPKFFGQNAWMPDSIGTAVFNGKLHSQWEQVKNSGAQITRFGGIAVDKNKPTGFQYLQIIDSMIASGMEPVVLVPFYNNKFTAAEASGLVDFINVINQKNVRYWVIGNEPDNSYGYTNATQVAAYVKEFSLLMKQKDPSIKILAPETAWYNKNILDGLTTPGGPSDITGKDSLGNNIVDFITFHMYPFRGTQKREDVITYLQSPGRFNDDLTELNQRITECNTFHQRDSSEALNISVTELNVNWKNPEIDNASGLGANSFLGGQFWAEALGIGMKNNVVFMNFWSVIEGNELGFIYHTTTLPKPTYFHFKLLAENFKGSYRNGFTNNSNVKSFACMNNNQVTVLFLNQDLSNYYYTLRLDTNSVSGTNPLTINADAGLPVEYSDSLEAESTVLMTFNAYGVLLKKCTYELHGNADSGLEPVCIITVPAVKIMSPLKNSIFTVDSAVFLLADVTYGESISNVGFFANGLLLGEDSIYPYSYNWENATAGIYFISAIATDSFSNTFISDTIPLTVYTPVQVSITEPANNSYFREDSSVFIEATITGGLGPVQNVSFFAYDTIIGVDAESPYNILWNNLIPGNYELKIIAADSAGNTGESEIIQVTVTYEYKILISSPADNSFAEENSMLTIVAFVYGETSPIQKVAFLANDSILAEDFDYPYAHSLSLLTGSYYFMAIATDSAGNIDTSDIIRATVYSLVSATILSPPDSSVFNRDSSIIIIADVSGGMGPVQKVEFFSDGGEIYEAVDTPYFFMWNNAPEGLHALGVIATDSGGNTVSSEFIHIRIFIPISILLTAPAGNSIYSEYSSVNLQASVSGGNGSVQRVEFFADSLKLMQDSLSPYSFTWDSVVAGNYNLIAIATDSTGNDAVSQTVPITVSKSCSASGSVLREVWMNITGTSVSAIPLNTSPDFTSQLTMFKAPENAGNYYGQRIRGYICVPVSGNYTFWISSDDKSELWLSTDDNPSNKVKIASVPGYTSSLQWSKYSTQKSAPKNLTAGKRYYIEALHKEGSKADNCAVGWQLPDGVYERPIPGNRLSPFIISAPPPVIEVDAGGDIKKMDGKKGELMVYPNPSTGQFNLELCIENFEEKSIAIEITDSFEKIVYEMQPGKKGGCIREEIELNSDLPLGIYFVKVIMEEKVSVTKMILAR